MVQTINTGQRTGNNRHQSRYAKDWRQKLKLFQKASTQQYSLLRKLLIPKLTWR